MALANEVAVKEDAEVPLLNLQSCAVIPFIKLQIMRGARAAG